MADKEILLITNEGLQQEEFRTGSGILAVRGTVIADYTNFRPFDIRSAGFKQSGTTVEQIYQSF